MIDVSLDKLEGWFTLTLIETDPLVSEDKIFQIAYAGQTVKTPSDGNSSHDLLGSVFALTP